MSDRRTSLPASRYSAVAMWLHWLSAILVFAVIPLGLIFGAFKTKPEAPDTFVAPFPGSPAGYASAHMTVGVLVFAVLISRLTYRLGHRPPPNTSKSSTIETILSQVTHWLFYTLLIIMPMSGYVMMSGDKPPIVMFGLYALPKLPISPYQGWTAAVIHVYGQFVLYALIIMHLGGTAWHMFIKRDNLIARMLPLQHDG